MDETLPDNPDSKEAEYREVKKLKESYDAARKFDKHARKQYAVDRTYAAGTADISWAVSTNLIGSYIEVLTSYIYAKDPDVGVRPAEHVDPDPETQAEAIRATVTQKVMAEGLPPEMAATEIEARTAHELQAVQAEDRRKKAETQAFGQTMELVISRLWKSGRLKKAARKQVRSVLSVGAGWLKVVMIGGKDLPGTFGIPSRGIDPEVQHSLNDARDNLARIQAKQREIAEGADDEEVAVRELEQLIQGLEANLEVAIRKGLAIDFVSAEDMQISLDVRDLDDHLEAGWNANAIYKPRDEVPEMFPDLTEEQIKQATCYYQRKPDGGERGANMVNEKDAEQFGKEGNQSADGDNVDFVKIIELWNRRTNLIYTMIDGVQCWAKKPFPPTYASSRFYPYFYLAFHEVDGSRHPQSLSFRLAKLQDEYASTRSSYRVTRKRSIPGVLFNSEQVGPDQAKKLENSEHQEFTGLKTTNPNVPFKDLFAEKPVPRIDPMLFDTQPIMSDMEKISGVQEALQSTVVTPKTATEAEIQQSGFAARTGADRDSLEDMLTELAQYTGEVALQALTTRDVQRIAGPAAFWPEGMELEDLLTMVEIEIEASSTGKPNTSAEREAWSVALPLIREIMVQVQQAQAQGNQPMADALVELLRETLNRMGDRIDVERFIPTLPAAPIVPPGGVAPGGPPPEIPPEQTDAPLAEVA